MENPVIILGAGYLGRMAKEILESNGNVVYGFLDDDKKLHGQEVDDATVLGSMDDNGFLKLIGKKCEACVAVDENRLKKNLVTMLNEQRHVQPVNAVHKGAYLSPKAVLGHGNLIDRSVQAGAGVVIGNHAVIHAGTIIGVGAQIGDYVQIGAGSIINPGAVIEEGAFIGTGVTIVAGLTIGRNARIGAGSVVIAPVAEGETVFGNPAQKVKT
ncbi:MAG: NeuD/PglB/VioB family sugar acetyltransferase [Flammeovirgaceae bacterium]|nr:MAG: NeuD/PglB/VioB family sugar acetyltransferase [Flammeovirgaceae bacterium]